MTLVSDVIKLDKIVLGTKEWEYHNHTYKTKYDSPGYQIVDSDRLIGIEVEVENANLVKVSPIWTAKEDGSLRNGGIEWISFPMKGKSIVTALNTLFSQLPSKHEFSNRTSIHIHVNVRDLEWEKIYRIFIIYLTCEFLLYEWVGQGRAENIFCIPWYKTNEINRLARKLKEFELTWLKEGHVQNKDFRYSGLNFDSLGRFGTLEFRQLGGTNDIIKIITWINILLSIVKFSGKYETKELISKIVELNTNSEYRAFVASIFGAMAPIFFNMSNMAGLVEAGVKEVKRSAISNKMNLQLEAQSPFQRVCANLGLISKNERMGVGYFFGEPAVERPLNPPIYGDARDEEPWNNVARYEGNEGMERRI